MRAAKHNLLHLAKILLSPAYVACVIILFLLIFIFIILETGGFDVDCYEGYPFSNFGDWWHKLP